MQCVAVCCSVSDLIESQRQGVGVVCCSVLQCAAVCCSVSDLIESKRQGVGVYGCLDRRVPMDPCVATCCNVLQCVTVCCSVLQCVAVDKFCGCLWLF